VERSSPWDENNDGFWGSPTDPIREMRCRTPPRSCQDASRRDGSAPKRLNSACVGGAWHFAQVDITEDPSNRSVRVWIVWVVRGSRLQAPRREDSLPECRSIAARSGLVPTAFHPVQRDEASIVVQQNRFTRRVAAIKA
jgi:hypothetical protein